MDDQIYEAQIDEFNEIKQIKDLMDATLWKIEESKLFERHVKAMKMKMGIVTQLKGQIYNYHNALVASHRDMAIATRDFGKSLEFVERFGFGHYSTSMARMRLLKEKLALLKIEAQRRQRKKADTRAKLATFGGKLREIRAELTKEPQVRLDLERAKMSVEVLKIKLKASRTCVKEEPIEEMSAPSLQPQLRIAENTPKAAKAPKAPKSRSHTSSERSQDFLSRFLERESSCSKCCKNSPNRVTSTKPSYDDYSSDQSQSTK